MTQCEDPRLLFGDRIPVAFIPELRAWYKNQPAGHFSRAEREIHSVAAVAWADPSRPTIVQAYRILCSLVDEDASFGIEGVRKPSLTTFRNRIRSLPPEFVRSMRLGRRRRATTFALVSAASAVLEPTFTNTAPVANDN
jgi:hypothetical protein